ncbi:hypothetical protein AALO_G00237450 [Alosa alosa]|uniref:SAM domain-containing protein n=2 Tax=Alosa alosa TaxID=278164 RepID=A0AAV6G2T1_9TELE|nr:hypothetical protein AALO_G00237450 [Alosa alosa]
MNATVGSSAELEEVSLRRRSWRERTLRFARTLFRCSCVEAQERDFALCSQDGRDDNLIAGTAEGAESIHIIVEDLGLINPTFILLTEDNQVEEEGGGPTSRCAMARSSSSVSASQRAARKRKLAPLSSLPIQPRAMLGSLNSEEDFLLFGGGGASASSGGTSDGGLLTPPVINLIPPTPSDVDAADDDQFFDINSEEDSVALTSGSEGVDSESSLATAELEAKDDKDGGRKEQVREEEEEKKTEVNDKMEDCSLSPPVREMDETDKETAAAVTALGESRVERSMQSFLRSTFQVAPLPEYPRKNDLSNKDSSSHDLLKTELRLLPLSSKMEAFLHQRKPAARTCSLGETVPRSHTFHAIGQDTKKVSEEEGSPRQRRITVASYIPQSKDQNGNFAGKESLNGPRAKALAELNTEEVCQWFSSIGLHQCLPLIRGAHLSGSQIASIDLSTLELLQVSNLDDRERLLSAIYEELHPPNTASQRVDSLLAAFGPHNVEKFTAALVSMTRSHSSPHVSNLNQCSFRFRQRSAVAQRNSQLIEVTIKVCASEQIVHLRTPQDTAVCKVLESCLRMLGSEEEKDSFILKVMEDELPMEQLLGDVLGTDSRLIELLLCKKEKPTQSELSASTPACPVMNNCDVENQIQCCNDEKLQELNQQVESLQNVILQVQELHHGLVAFCGELRNMDAEPDTEGLSSAELEEQLAQTQSSLQDKRQRLQALKDSLSTVAIHRTHRRVEVRLLEKMRLNCHVFQEEITLVHLNRQLAHLQVALEECQVKEEKAERKQRSTLGQLVSLQSPAMLVATQETQGPDGFGFTVQLIRGQGLVVVHRLEESHLCVSDRLVEVNGVSVVGSGEDELQALLRHQTTAHIVVLRRPPPNPPPVQELPADATAAVSAPRSTGVYTAVSR